MNYLYPGHGGGLDRWLSQLLGIYSRKTRIPYMPYMRSGNIFSHLMLCDKLQQSITGDSGSHFGSGLLKKVINFVKDKLLLIILQSD